ncbi:MAG: P1 family peptidase [Armatimonadota bacterium]|nr:P1 family peptidase [Armatimonadota bacterium]MCX7776875.1 P1 family peptidase [Armatimonadota bacterium]MDW8024439.1 P1 family peptidase [Armatimonadota bacterium]
MLERGASELSNVHIGHVSEIEAGTGCTVLLFPEGAVCGVDVRGSASGTFGIDTAGILHVVPYAHALVFTGGSAFGLESVFGVMRWLEEKNIGFDVGVTKVPIVCGAVIFDLYVGSHNARPNADWGYRACESAVPLRNGLMQGNIGAGTGASVGKVLGMEHAMKGGLGLACVELPNSVFVFALTVVNAWGDVVNWRTSEIVAGAYDRLRRNFINSMEVVKVRGGIGFASHGGLQSTTLAAVITNARLEKWQATKLAQAAQDGIALAVRPAHTMFDGDTAFAFSVGATGANMNSLCVAAVEAVAQAILNAVTYAQSVHGLPAASNLRQWA